MSEQKWMNNLVLVRHGESDWNVQKAAAQARGEAEYGVGVRDPDVVLTDEGVRQARTTSGHLRSRFTFDIVYSSPYRRTIQTTKLLLGEFAPPPEVIIEERIREKEFGILEGLTPAGREERLPDEVARKERQGKYYYRPPGGENFPDVNLRLHSFLGTLTRDWRGKSVLVVCHSAVVLGFRRLLERLTEQELMAIDKAPDQEVQNCSVTWYEFDPGAGPKGKLV